MTADKESSILPEENLSVNETHQPKLLESCIRQRRSVRVFTTDSVPPNLLHESLKLASLAPSNSNIQNWRLTLANGAVRDRAIAALREAATTSAPSTAPIPSYLRHFRSEFGHILYGPTGYNIPRSQPEKHRQA
ncbi:unnamed protein product [Periconia digitata]|uniref:Nitroreductase domain-containing protein n=1 Tax=Periconia digitata TaxID=1303443 RepID=A0A9W4XRT1_9PLEO|nr:unnamed protein product [Periconia digitata]